MAVVLPSSQDGDLFASSDLRRSRSQIKFSKTQSSKSSGFSHSSSKSKISDAFCQREFFQHHEPYRIDSESSSSALSSPSATPTGSGSPTDHSYSSTPATNLSLDGDHFDHLVYDIEQHTDEADDDTCRIVLPVYGDSPYFEHAEDLEPPPSPRTGHSYTVSPAEPETSAPDSPTLTQMLSLFDRAEDDTAARPRPTQHVDYLSHKWKEEDIWSSWRYIVSKRGEFSNSHRLENASWRTWAKNKYNLRTVSPEALNWLKEVDVTWLYGPLQTRQFSLSPCDREHCRTTWSRNHSFIKKPILKKRSMSEIMLAKSISSSSLLKQATAAVQAQQSASPMLIRPRLQRAATDYATCPISSRRESKDSSLVPSSSTSGFVSPSVEKKHIHFDEQVKQCIAVEIKGDDDEEEPPHWMFDDDSDSDDDAFMMKKMTSKKKPLSMDRKPRPAAGIESKTIAMLPSTTLKYRRDTPEQNASGTNLSNLTLRSPMLSPSSSQETLRPSRSAGSLFTVDEDNEDMIDAETSTTPVSSPTDAVPPIQAIDSLKPPSPTDPLEPAGMHRTDSGMFMPYEEDEGSNYNGMFSRVVDTVNTARDIAHVVWNVGWRR